MLPIDGIITNIDDAITNSNQPKHVRAIQYGTVVFRLNLSWKEINTPNNTK